MNLGCLFSGQCFAQTCCLVNRSFFVGKFKGCLRIYGVARPFSAVHPPCLESFSSTFRSLVPGN